MDGKEEENDKQNFVIDGKYQGIIMETFSGFLSSVWKCLFFPYTALFSRVQLKAWILESDCFSNLIYVTGRMEPRKLVINSTSLSLSFLVCEIVIIMVTATLIKGLKLIMKIKSPQTFASVLILSEPV